MGEYFGGEEYMAETPVKKRTRKKSQLALHIEGECGCSRSENPNNCVYQEFLDGWSFTPDVGNGQKRGEVFTPRFIVDKMMVDVGLFPAEGVYEGKYTASTVEEAVAIVEAKVLEPAIGTANYLSSVLWHKLQYAWVASVNTDGELDLQTYHHNLLTAVASVYANDIDAGNIEVARRRLLAHKNAPLKDADILNRIAERLSSILEMQENDAADLKVRLQEKLEQSHNDWHVVLEDGIQELIQENIPKELTKKVQAYHHHAAERLTKRSPVLNDTKTLNAWVKEIKNSLSSDEDHTALIKTVAKESLEHADQHWARFFDADQGGVIQQLYRLHTGEELPEFLYKDCVKLLASNIKLFNTIVKEDTIEEAFVCPGWKNIHWDWWTISSAKDGKFRLTRKKVSLAEQLLSGEIEQLENRAARLKEEKMVEKMDGLFPIQDWATDKDRLEYEKILKNITKLQKELKAL